jgi:hypothetical protein
MSYGDLDAFQDGFNECLKKRLDSPGAKPVSEVLVPMDDANATATQLTEDSILAEALERIEITFGQLV